MEAIEREKRIKQALDILKELWRDIYDEAGRPLDYCPDEDLYFAIERLEGALHGT